MASMALPCNITAKRLNHNVWFISNLSMILKTYVSSLRRNIGAMLNPLHTSHEYNALADYLNAYIKVRFGTLTHRMTARILDNYQSVGALQDLISNKTLLDDVITSTHTALQSSAAVRISSGVPQVAPSSVHAPTVGSPYMKNDGGFQKMPSPGYGGATQSPLIQSPAGVLQSPTMHNFTPTTGSYAAATPTGYPPYPAAPGMRY